jgi:hypothetical protein
MKYKNTVPKTRCNLQNFTINNETIVKCGNISRLTMKKPMAFGTEECRRYIHRIISGCGGSVG